MKGSPYLEWPQSYLNSFLKGINEILFIPYAGVTMSYDDYSASVSHALEPLSIKVKGIHRVADKFLAIAQASCIAVGGGNTFQLLATMQREEIIEPIRNSIYKGTPYIGWSAGSIVACPTIRTTNDMPIVEPSSFDALNLVDFQINAHYTERTIADHGGESRNLRIKEFTTVNLNLPVVGLPEGKLLELDGDKLYLKGTGGEKTILFRCGKEKQSLTDGIIEI